MDQLAIEVRAVSKAFRSFWRVRPALRELSLAVPRGACFGLAGPSGAGKTTLIGILSARLRPDSGTVTTLPHASYIVGGSPGFARRLESFERRAPDLLVLDEPLAAMNPSGKRDAIGALRNIHRAGSTVLIASRDLAAIEQMCSGLAILHRGEVLASGKTADLRTGRGCRVAVAALSGSMEASLAASGFLVGVHDREYWVASPDRARLNELIDRLRAANVTIESIADLRPSLEQIYRAAATKDG
jgi:ABC-type multidrug transport system ATPase subunit